MLQKNQMPPEDVKEQIQNLRKKIRRHNRLYYVEADPEISDREYDKLYSRLEELEEQYPGYATKDSPTQRVGGEPLEEFENYDHAEPMLSLDNTYSEEEIEAWVKRISKKIEVKKGFLVEQKFDGIGLSLVYKNGKLDVAATRGDGYTGDNITENIKKQHAIPLSLNGENLPGFIEIRGEVYIKKSELKRLNKKRKKEGKSVFSNPRNTCAGTLKLLDPKKSSERRLSAAFYAVGEVKDGQIPDTQDALLQLYGEWGLPVNKDYRNCSNREEIREAYIEFEDMRGDLDYEIDGAVIKVNSFEEQRKLGTTAKSPRWAVAYKFEAKSGEAKLKKIEFNVSRTGKITPVAKLSPVEVGGVVISSATLYNFDKLNELNLKIGDTVRVKRAGDVIPKITEVIKKSEDAQKINIPSSCPSCGTKLSRDPEGVYVRCNNISCPAQLKSRLIHYAKPDAMDIEGLGESVAEQLTEEGYIEKLDDIYRLSFNDLIKLDLFGEKKANNLLKSIESSKERPLEKFIYALGIREVGSSAAKILADRYKNIDDFLNAEFSELENIDEIGPVTAEFIVDFVQKNTGLVRRMLEKGVAPTYTQTKNLLEGKKFVFTGSLGKFTRKEAKEAIEKLGGRVVSSVSSNTDFLVQGESPGSKLEKARENEVTIITEADFLDILKDTGE